MNYYVLIWKEFGAVQTRSFISFESLKDYVKSFIGNISDLKPVDDEKIIWYCEKTKKKEDE